MRADAYVVEVQLHRRVVVVVVVVEVDVEVEARFLLGRHETRDTQAVGEDEDEDRATTPGSDDRCTQMGRHKRTEQADERSTRC